MAKAIQYRGTPRIIAAFKEEEIPNWAVLHEGRIIKKCAGENMDESLTALTKFLKGLEASNTTTAYELRLYEDVTDHKKIRTTTDADLCWNITLFSDEYMSAGQSARSESLNQVVDRLSNIEVQLAMLKKEEEGEEEEPAATSGVGSMGQMMLGTVNKLLDNPEIQQKLGDRFFTWIDKLLSPAAAAVNALPMRQPAAMNGVGQTAAPIKEITQEQADKIQQAVNILAGIVPNLGDTLMLLADAAKEDPVKFNKRIGMLKTFL